MCTWLCVWVSVCVWNLWWCTELSYRVIACSGMCWCALIKPILFLCMSIVCMSVWYSTFATFVQSIQWVYSTATWNFVLHLCVYVCASRHLADGSLHALACVLRPKGFNIYWIMTHPSHVAIAKTWTMVEKFITNRYVISKVYLVEKYANGDT